jgi:hypothetical protein
MHNLEREADGAESAHDKPWMIVDHNRTSAFRGAVYVAVSDFPLPAEVGAEPKLIHPPLVLSISKDNGRTFDAPRPIAGSAFWPSFAVGRTGSLEIVYSELVWAATEKSGQGHVQESNAILHVRSVDGGASFTTPVPIVRTMGEGRVSSPTMANRSNGDALACWVQETRPEQGQQVRCAFQQAGRPWGQPGLPRIDLGSSTVAAFPVVASAADAWFLLLYLIGPTHTEVAIFRTTGQSDFVKVSTLAVVDVGRDRMCLPERPCPQSQKDVFDVGDYVAMTSTGGRLAAAYVLPRPAKGTLGTPAVYVSLLDEVH